MRQSPSSISNAHEGVGSPISGPATTSGTTFTGKNVGRGAFLLSTALSV
jgi:hypothetical protein